MAAELARTQAVLWAERTLRNLPAGDPDAVRREVAAAETALQMLRQSQHSFPGAAETYRDYIRFLCTRMEMLPQ